MRERGSGVAFITEPPAISITANVAHGHYRSGASRTKWAMSVKVLQATRDRINRALDRYAAGDEHVIVDD